MHTFIQILLIATASAVRLDEDSETITIVSGNGEIDPVTEEQWGILGGASGGINKSDIGQGNLGNCYFLAALAAIAEQHPQIIVDMFEKGSLISDSNVFTTKWAINGKTTRVAVNDMLPAPASGIPYFQQVKQGNYWAPILEKAFAKLFGSYDRLTGGKINEVFKAITQAPVKTLDTKKTEQNVLLQTMKEATDSKYPMAAATASTENPIGIVTSHAYAVLKVVEEYGDYGTVVLIYNPHGADNYNGSIPNENKADGSFYCTLEEFISGFYEITIAEVYADYKLTEKVLETNSDEGGTKKKVVMEFDITDDSVFHVQFEWPSHRFLAEGCAYVEPRFVMAVARKDNLEDFVFGVKSSMGMTNARATIKKGSGRYVVFLSAVFSNAPWLDEFVVNVYAGAKTELNVVSTGAAAVDTFLSMYGWGNVISGPDSPSCECYFLCDYELNRETLLNGLPVYESKELSVWGTKSFVAFMPIVVHWYGELSYGVYGQNEWVEGESLEKISNRDHFPTHVEEEKRKHKHIGFRNATAGVKRNGRDETFTTWDGKPYDAGWNWVNYYRNCRSGGSMIESSGRRTPKQQAELLLLEGQSVSAAYSKEACDASIERIGRLTEIKDSGNDTNFPEDASSVGDTRFNEWMSIRDMRALFPLEE